MAISKLRADLGLLSVTFFWGTTFIISKLLLVDVPLPVYLALRLGIAALAMNLFAVRHRRAWNSKTMLHGMILGMLLYLSYFFQMWGIQFTSASNAGFITGMSVILVPVFGFFFFKMRASWQVLVGIGFAVAGLLLLTGAHPLHWNSGDLLVLICAVAVAFHVIYTGRFAPLHNIYLLTAVQLTTVAVLALLALPFSTFNWPSLTVKHWEVLLYLGLFGTVFTFLMQTAMQRFTTTARTALIFAMEPVFAALFAFLVAGESLTLTGWIGGLLIVVGMISAELGK